jgi:hypothetical protein
MHPAGYRARDNDRRPFLEVFAPLAIVGESPAGISHCQRHILPPLPNAKSSILSDAARISVRSFAHHGAE